MEGRHGVIADSLATSWEQVRAQTRLDDVTLPMSGPRVVPPDDVRTSEGRNWTLYESIDRTQIFAATETRTTRALLVRGSEVQFGRGRVFDAPYSPVMNTGQFPFRAPGAVGANNIMARARCTRFSGTSLQAAALLAANETLGVNGTVTVLDNYRAWVTEGFPTIQKVPDYAFILAAAQLDVPLTLAGDGPLCTPVPDYAVTVRVDNPSGNVIAPLTRLSIAWVDAFGVRWPTSLATGGEAPYVELGDEVTVPAWASLMHLVTFGAGPVNVPAQITWSLQL